MARFPKVLRLTTSCFFPASLPFSPPKPGPEVKKLDYNIGTWNVEGEAKPFRDDAYAYFNVIRDGRNDHGKGATQLGRCAAVFLELSLWDS